jgi:hypothetical protein
LRTGAAATFVNAIVTELVSNLHGLFDAALSRL